MKKQKQNLSASINDNLDNGVNSINSNINIKENETVKRERNFPSILDEYVNKKPKSENSTSDNNNTNNSN